MARWLTVGLMLLIGTAAFSAEPTAARPRRLLLLSQGPDGHPRATHEYVAGINVLARSLRDVPNLEVVKVRADGAWEDGPEQLKQADGVVLYLSEGAKWLSADMRRRDAFAQVAQRGGGLVALHWAMGTKTAEPIAGFVELFGGCHGGPDRRYQVLETSLEPADTTHPATVGLTKFRIHDEFYYQLKFVRAERGVRPLLHAQIDDQSFPVAWTWERPDGGRSFGFSGIHFHENWRREEYRRLVGQAILWTLKLPVPANGFPAPLEPTDFELPTSASR